MLLAIKVTMDVVFALVLQAVAENASSDCAMSSVSDAPNASLAAPRAVLHSADCVDVMKRMSEKTCTLVLADPPYENVVSESWDAVKDYMEFSRAWLTEAARILLPGGALLVYGSPERNWTSRMAVLLEDELGMNLVQNLAWVYNQGGGSRVSTMKKYAVQHEVLLWFEKPGGGRVFSAERGVEHYKDDERAVALAKGKGRVSEASLDRGRPPRSFLDFQRENSRSKERSYGGHPCMKPLPLCEHLVKLHSQPGSRVFVPFAGSGSELLSAAKLGRVAEGAETSAEYVELIKRRFDGHGVAVRVHDAQSTGPGQKRPRDI